MGVMVAYCPGHWTWRSGCVCQLSHSLPASPWDSRHLQVQLAMPVKGRQHFSSSKMYWEVLLDHVDGCHKRSLISPNTFCSAPTQVLKAAGCAFIRRRSRGKHQVPLEALTRWSTSATQPLPVSTRSHPWCATWACDAWAWAEVSGLLRLL